MSYAKDCPFCGSNESHYEWITTNIVVIQCDDCNAHGTTAYTEDDALDAWNQRPYDYDMPAIVKKVQQIEKENKQLHDLLIRADINLQQWIMSFPRAVDKEDKTLIELFKEANQSCKQPE